VARCEAGFLLWRLPYAPDCSAGYGTVLMGNAAQGCPKREALATAKQ